MGRVQGRSSQTETPRRAPQRNLFLPGLMLLTLAAKGVVLAQLHAHPLLQPGGGLDTDAYVTLARRVAAGDLALGPEPYYLAPLYAYFLGLVFALTGGSLLLAQVAQIALGALAPLLAHATTRRFAGEIAARVAAALVAITGLHTFSEVLLLQSALDPFLVALALWLLARALAEHAGRRAWLLAGVGLGLFALNRPNALLAALGLAVLVALHSRTRAGLARAALLAGGVALALAPVTLRNLVVSGEPILIASHGGLNLSIGNHEGADGTYRRVPGVTPDVLGQARDAQRVAAQALGRPVSARETSAWFAARAVDWARAHPGDALRLFARKLAYVFNAADLPLNFSYAFYAREERTLLRALAAGPPLLLPLGLLGLLWRARVRDAEFRLWAAFVPLYALSVALFFVAGRYRQPLLVPLAVGAGIAVERAWRAWHARETRALGSATLSGLALWGATSWPFGFDDGRAAERAALVAWLVDTGRLDEARARLERGEPDAPLSSELLLRVANVAEERGQGGFARELLERAHARDPRRTDMALALGRARLAAGDASGALAPLRAALATPEAAARAEAHERLGVALSLLGRAAEALAELEQACRLAPRVASAQLNRAVALALLGELDEARAALEEALRLKPGYARALGLRAQLARAEGGDPRRGVQSREAAPGDTP